MTPLSLDASGDWSMPAWGVLTVAVVAVVLLVVAVVAAVAGGRARGRARHELAELRQRVEELQERVGPDALAVRSVPRGPVVEPMQAEYHITSLGEQEPAPTGARVTVAPAPVADALLREGVVQTASFLHGVRRALAPETRNRIAFEMRRELKRSRKERKAEVKEALREYRARHRAEAADQPDLSAAEVAR
jgi:hypothetical protein